MKRVKIKLSPKQYKKVLYSIPTIYRFCDPLIKKKGIENVIAGMTSHVIFILDKKCL